MRLVATHSRAVETNWALWSLRVLDTLHNAYKKWVYEQYHDKHAINNKVVWGLCCRDTSRVNVSHVRDSSRALRHQFVVKIRCCGLSPSLQILLASTNTLCLYKYSLSLYKHSQPLQILSQPLQILSQPLQILSQSPQHADSLHPSKPLSN